MPPISVMIKPVSGMCNMHCKYCFYMDEMLHRSTPVYKPMDKLTLENLIRKVFAYAEGNVSIAFQGGEPTLAGPEFYRYFLSLEERYNSREIQVHHALQTNGLSLSEEMLDVLKEGRFLLGVSLDGTKEIHDSRRLDSGGQPTFKRIEHTLSKLTKRGIEFQRLNLCGRVT